MPCKKYYDYYERKNLSFEKDILTTYCLSLYTKPFVILSGISGTGKTKIAQFFNNSISESLCKKNDTKEYYSPLGNWIIMPVTKAVFGGDGRVNLQFKHLDALLEQSEIAELQSKINELKRIGAEDNICEPFDFVIETPDGKELKAKAYLQRASSPLLRVRLKSKRGEPEYDSTPYFTKNYDVGNKLKLEKISSRRLKIVSVDDKEVINKSSEIEKEENSRIENSCFLSVRADWTDPTPLFGYYNLIDQRYHLTPALSFILKAKENPNIPFFMILDEMNLAKVEHYFSDFISCLESRYMENGVLKQEPIHLHSESGWVNTNNDYFDVISGSLEIPSNLFVTGTVNVDESTYMFSPKVLDRANVIELNKVDIKRYAGSVRSKKEETFLLERLPDFTHFDLPGKNDFESIPEDARKFLISIHSILSKYRLHFGYRVINEISKYLLNTLEFCENQPHVINEALDWQLVQKVFPKFSGPQSKLEAPVHELLKFLTYFEEDVSSDIKSSSPVAPTNKYPRSVEKLKRISLDLETNGFANFIE